eukprot:m.9141 g.9141  ORF g.9141 m.9141 type:complete len:56 (+) comp5638_c0_seq2:645-812(+)
MQMTAYTTGQHELRFLDHKLLCDLGRSAPHEQCISFQCSNDFLFVLCAKPGLKGG